MRYYIGIDPGLSGAIVGINENGELEAFNDTPIITLRNGKKSKTDYLPSKMVESLRQYKNKPHHVFLESVHSMPHEGVSSVFGFGKGFGLWIGILAALEMPHTFVTPQAWKKVMMAGQGDKDASRLRALELFPHLLNILGRKRDHNRAEALLLAEFGRRSLGMPGSYFLD